MRVCKACDSPNAKAIDQQLRSGATQTGVAAWTAQRGAPISRAAIQRHATAHLALAPRPPGPRPVSGDFLVTVRDSVHADDIAGTQRPTVGHGLAAQAQIDHRADKATDRDLQILWAQVLGGAIPYVKVLPSDEGYTAAHAFSDALEDEAAADDAEFTLLLSGRNSSDPETAAAMTRAREFGRPSNDATGSET
jgi:hypothetical protein